MTEQPKVGSEGRLMAQRCVVCGYWPAFDVPVGLGNGVPPGHRCTYEWVEVEPVGQSASEVERLREAGEELYRLLPSPPVQRRGPYEMTVSERTAAMREQTVANVRALQQECERQAREVAKVRADAEQLREALSAVFQLAAVSWEGDPWYAEEEGIDGEAVLTQARAALHSDEEQS